MDYKVLLNNGSTIDLLNAEFDENAFTTTLNDPKIIFVNIAGAILQKHIINGVIPVSATQTETQA